MTLPLQSPRWRYLLRRVARRLFRYAENNDNPSIETNGELWLLRRLLNVHAARGDGRPFVAFDVGANTGEYTARILAEARRLDVAVEVHVFEPSPHCLELLRRRFPPESSVRIIGAAVADQVGHAPLFSDADGSSLASLVDRPVLTGAKSDAIHVSMLRLQDYARDHGISRVSLLKLDVEGSELRAMRGGGDWLTPGQVDVVQFEYGGTTLDAGTTLKQVFQVLADRQYRMAKLLPCGLDLRTYQPWMENYDYANYVALAPHWCGVDSVRGRSR